MDRCVVRGWATGLGLVITACGGSGAAPSASAAPHVITPQAAAKVAQDYNAANNAALRAPDVAANDKIEEGWAALIDDFSYKYAQFQAAAFTADTADTVTKVVVPHQAAFPAQFVAEVTRESSGQAPLHQLYLFTQDAKTAPWRLAAAATVFPNTPYPNFFVGGDGYGGLIRGQDQQQGLRSDGGATLASYAEYLNSGLTGTAPPTFADGPGTSGYVTAVKASQQAHAASFSSTLTFHAEPSTTVFRLANGNGLALGALRGLEQEHPTADSPLYQNPTRTNWGPAISPGDYQSISDTSLLIAAVEIPSKSSPQKKMGVVGFSTGTIEAAAS